MKTRTAPPTLAAFLEARAAARRLADLEMRARTRLAELSTEEHDASDTLEEAHRAHRAALERDVLGDASPAELASAEASIRAAEAAVLRVEERIAAAQAVVARSEGQRSKAQGEVVHGGGRLGRDVLAALVEEDRALIAAAYAHHGRLLRLLDALGAAATGEAATLGSDGTPGSIDALAAAAGLRSTWSLRGGERLTTDQVTDELARIFGAAAKGPVAA